MTVPVRHQPGHAAFDARTISLRMRMLAKVPRIITLWLPRRAPCMN